MPIFFGIVGLVLVITALNNTLSGPGGLGDLIKKDFTGSNNFLVWMAALVIIGLIGYIPKFKPVSYAFFTLIILAIVLANQKSNSSGGLFGNLFSAINGAGTGNTPTPGGSGGGAQEVNPSTLTLVNGLTSVEHIATQLSDFFSPSTTGDSNAPVSV